MAVALAEKPAPSKLGVQPKNPVGDFSVLSLPRLGLEVPFCPDCIGKTAETYEFPRWQTLSYLRARYYDPVTGQFLTGDTQASLTLARYSYVSGNPLNFGDPSGLRPTNDPETQLPCNGQEYCDYFGTVGIAPSFRHEIFGQSWGTDLEFTATTKLHAEVVYTNGVANIYAIAQAPDCGLTQTCGQINKRLLSDCQSANWYCSHVSDAGILYSADHQSVTAWYKQNFQNAFGNLVASYYGSVSINVYGCVSSYQYLSTIYQP